MVLTRAQRAQATGDEKPPEPAALSASMLKAPARRGRAKKAEPEPEPAKAAKAASKTITLKSSVLKASTSKAAPTRATASTRPTASKATVAKPVGAKPAATKRAILSKSETRAPRATKPPVPSRRIRKAEPVSPEKAVEQTPHAQEEAPIAEKEVEGVNTQAQDEPQQITMIEDRDNVMPSEQDEHDLIVVNVMKSPSKLPRPAPAPPSEPRSVFKTSSLCSPFKSLGSPRKQPVVGALFNSPAKALASSNAMSVMDLGSPKRPQPNYETPGISANPKRPGMLNASTYHEEAPIFEPMAYSVSPKRPAEASGTDFDEQASPKRLKTAISMPALSFGSPVRSTSSSMGGSTSPVKSSLRSPVKQPGLSPKKSVTFRQPDPPTPVPVEALQQLPGIFDGLVFFLDMYNQTGVDSKHLFAPLVEQLGGEWVPEWTSNAMPVTHVVFMNGELRTLEKVVASNGEVHVVNISWLLDCERENLHLDEKDFRYAVDLARVPGLHTPKPLKSMPNTPMISRTPAAPPPEAAETPAPYRQPLGISSGFVIKTPAYLASKTPGPPPSVGVGPIPEEDKENVSPGTDNSPLQQKTCPPKQLGKSLFSKDSLGSPLKNRWLFGRRKSADFAPKIGSPLRNGFGK